jgi:hypothetical protein
MHNSKVLNSPEYLNLLLSDKKIRLINSEKKIGVKDMSHLIGQKNKYLKININKYYIYNL